MSNENETIWAEDLEQLQQDIEQPTAIAKREPPKEGILLPVSPQMIDAAWKEVESLKIAGTADIAGYKAVKDAKWKFTKFRTATEAWKKKMNEDAQKQIKLNGEQAGKLLKAIEPKEAELQARLTAIDVAIAEEKQRAEDELYDLRRAKLKEAAGDYPQFMTLSETATRMMTETEFASEVELVRGKAAEQKRRDDELAVEKFEREQEQARIAEENRKQAAKLAEERAEMDRIRAERAAELKEEQDKLDTIRREQAEAQAKIDAENKRIADEAAAKVREEQLAQARKEAAERAARETEERLAREAEAARVKAEREAEAARIQAEREEALRPDREKVRSVGKILRNVDFPNVESDESNDFLVSLRDRLIELAEECELFGVDDTE